MPKILEFRPITEEERIELEQLKRSQTAEARLVERAKMVLWFHTRSETSRYRCQA